LAPADPARLSIPAGPKLPLVWGHKPKRPQTSAEMQARIERWLRGLPLTFQSVQALLPDVPGCERLLRSKGIQEVPVAGSSPLAGQFADAVAAVIAGWEGAPSSSLAGGTLPGGG
jgi:hypothetical protein